MYFMAKKVIIVFKKMLLTVDHWNPGREVLISYNNRCAMKTDNEINPDWLRQVVHYFEDDADRKTFINT